MAESITLQQMRPKLLSLDTVKETLARSEPLAIHPFTVGDGIRFNLASGWQHGIDAKAGTDLVDATITVGTGLGAREFPLHKDALLEATSVCGIGKTYAARCPAELLIPQLNYWWREGMSSKGAAQKDFQLLVTAGEGAAVVRQSINPFSNLRLLEQAINGIEAKFGKTEVLADYKFAHSLRRTHLRLILPAQARDIVGTGTANDTWSIGVQLKNSLIGFERTEVSGYLFRWWCTNGAIDTHSDSGLYRRTGHESDAGVYDWARSAIDDVLGGLEPALDAVQNMVNIPVGGEANEILRDVFTQYRVALPERTRIIENMVEAAGDLNMYTVMNAITEVANSDLEPSHVESLLRLGGDLPHAANSRCEACRRLMPH